MSWASRNSDSVSSRSSHSSSIGRVHRHVDDPGSPSRLIRRADQPAFFSPLENRLVEESPVPLSTPDRIEAAERTAQALEAASHPRASSSNSRVPRSAPAELGPVHRKITKDLPKMHPSLGTDLIFNHPMAEPLVSYDAKPAEDFELDPEAPVRAQRPSENERRQATEPSPLHLVPETNETPIMRVDDVAPISALGVEPGREGWGGIFQN